MFLNQRNNMLCKKIFIILVFFFHAQEAHTYNNNHLDNFCTFSYIPLINRNIGCRKVTIEEINSLKEYWSSEINADLCHYFYFPIADPYATKQLLLENYLIMEKEIIKRDINCMRDYRNIFWYRGEETKSMLKKLIEKYPSAINQLQT